jgi:hypothetical protein
MNHCKAKPSETRVSATQSLKSLIAELYSIIAVIKIPIFVHYSPVHNLEADFQAQTQLCRHQFPVLCILHLVKVSYPFKQSGISVDIQQLIGLCIAIV